MSTSTTHQEPKALPDTKNIVDTTEIVPKVEEQSTQKRDSGQFYNINAKFTPREQVEDEKIIQKDGVGKSSTEESERDRLYAVSCAGKNDIWGLSKKGDLFKLVEDGEKLEWQYVPIGNVKLSDISVARHGIVFGIGKTNGALYRLTKIGRMELVLPDDNTHLQQVDAQTKKRIYALTEHGHVLYMKLGLLTENQSWTRLGPTTTKLKKIAVGGKHLFRQTELWGIGIDDFAYRWKYDTQWDRFDASLIDISVSKDNAVYGVRKEDGRVMKWDGKKDFLLLEHPLTDPNMVFDHLTNIKAYKEGKCVYAVEKQTGTVLKMY